MTAIETVSALNFSQKEEVLLLQNRCAAFEPLTLSFPCDDADCFFLLYDDNRELAAALSLFFTEPGLCESAAFTRPELRRRGFFRLLLEAAETWMEQYEEATGLETDWCFVIDGRSPAALETVRNLEMELWYEECAMSLSLDQSAPGRLSGTDSGNRAASVHAGVPNPLSLRLDWQPDHLILAYPDDGETADKPVGSCRLILNQDRAYFYEFQISREFRSRGLGKTMLQLILNALKSRGVRTVTLQVSCENLPAMSLYQKTGFQITETLSYYLY